MSSDKKSVSYTKASGGDTLMTLSGLNKNAKTSELTLKNNVVTIGKNAIGTSAITATGDGYKFVLASAGKLTYAGAKATLQGSTGNDTLIGGSKADTIYGGKGNDSLVGGAGNDKLFGDAGADHLIGGKGDDSLTGGTGNDTLTGGVGNDVITDYSADDKIKLTSGTVSSYTLNGNDGILQVGNNTITLKNVGNSAVTVLETKTFESVLKFDKTELSKATSATVTSGYSSNSFSATSYSALVTVTAANFGKSINLTGNDKNNKLIGSAKADTLIGGKGDDTLTGGKGNDTFIYANGDGNDVITDYSADDKIKLTSGTVSSYTLNGNDGILQVGNNTITLKNVGNSAVTVIDANDKTTTLESGLKFDKTELSKATSATVTSGYTSNSFSAASYSALVTVTAANFGKSVSLTGNAKNNKLIGSSKADTLSCGKGNDTLTGGKGNDIFQYASGDDTITDYAAGDKIKITKGTISKTTVKNNDVIFTVGKGSITVQNGKGKQISITDENGKTTTKTYNKTISSYDLIVDSNYSTSQLDSILQVQSLGDVEFSDNKTLNDSLQSVLTYSEK